MASLLNKIEKRFECKIEQDLISEILNYLYENSGMPDNTFENYIPKEEQSNLLLSYIEEKDLYFNDIRFSKFVDEGAEQKVFLDDEKNRVIKFNDAIFYVNWTQYLESLLVHNILFKETAYKLEGFITINSVIYAVVSQDYIKPTEKTNISTVKSFMQKKGFTLKKNNDYVHNTLGIIIEDLHEENVLIHNGTLFFIDTVIYFV